MDAYKEIMQLNEAECFKQLIEKWEKLYKNLQVFPKEKPILLPDIFWVGPSGSGRTKLISLMAEYLKDKPQLMEFSGQVDFFEFMLTYCPVTSEMNSLVRFIDEVEWASGFRNEFKGIININVSEWLGHCEEKNFLVFLEYLSANSGNWMIILSAESDDMEAVKNMRAVVSMYLRVEQLTTEAPKTDSLIKKIISFLDAYGLSLDGSAKELLQKSIDKLRKNKYFDGYKTVEMLAQDIIYEIMSDASKETGVISASQLAAFADDGEYVEKAIQTKKQFKRIGFVSDSEE